MILVTCAPKFYDARHLPYSSRSNYLPTERSYGFPGTVQVAQKHFGLDWHGYFPNIDL